MPPICRNQGHSHLSLSARLGVNEACAFWADLRATLTKHDLKGILHPKIKILISFTHPQVEFLQLNTKEDILKNDWNFGTIDFHSIFFPTMEVNGAKQPFGSNHSSKYQNKEPHTGLQQ